MISTSTYCPGQRLRSSLAKAALAVIVPEAMSTVESTKLSLPSVAVRAAFGTRAVTGTGFEAASAPCKIGNSLSGRAKETRRGFIWVMVRRPVPLLLALALTRLPGVTCTVPMRPSIGAVMRV